ncbi:putative periplasmic protein [Thermoplasmatales archaeon SCGC AB-539-N05]|nr:putative periplasmic protein [Thermoplasmatales archaeon SCGC AB-539-N05]
MKKTPLILALLIILSTFSGCIHISDNQNNHEPTDSDGDGVPDDKDVFPYDPNEQSDSDGDGVGDNSDAFPLDPAASVDSDNDTFPDAWNPDRTQNDSTSIPPLELDEFPDDSTEWKDTDGDGVGDNSDIDPTVDIAINFKLKAFEVIEAVDPFSGIWPRAQIYFEIHMNNRREARVDDHGYVWRVWLNNKQEINQDFKYNIDDHKDNRYTDIEVIMYDDDVFGRDIVDISNTGNENTLRLQYDAEDDCYNRKTQGKQGILWYEITSSKVEYNKTYSWEFKNKNWELSLDIPIKTYVRYRNSKVVRNPQSVGSAAMASFVTSGEPVIVDLTNKLQLLVENEGYNNVTMVNFVLRFIQYLRYSEDNASVGPNEYWRYPVETLVDETGDCEDTSVLFASIMERMGYDAVLLLYVIEKNDNLIGHLAVGMHADDCNGDFVSKGGRRYYYCETTTRGYEIGITPKDYKDKTPTSIIQVQ